MLEKVSEQLMVERMHYSKHISVPLIMKDGNLLLVNSVLQVFMNWLTAVSVYTADTETRHEGHVLRYTHKHQLNIW